MLLKVIGDACGNPEKIQGFIKISETLLNLEDHTTILC